MKKIAVIALLASLSSLQASEYQVMVGLETGMAKGKQFGQYTDWIDHAGIRAGLETDKSRIYGSFENITDENVLKDRGTLVSLLNMEAKTQKYYEFFRVFAGGHLGTVNTKYKRSIKDKKVTDVAAGVQAGVLAEFTDQLSLEIGYKQTWADADKDLGNLSSIQKLYAAINVKF